jgi:hypothetical protein
LQKPFYFCVSDFCTDTFLQNETLSTENWIGICETKLPDMYSTVKVQGEIVEKLINKSPDGFNHAFTGIFYMYDYKLFWNSFDQFVDEKKEVVDIFTNVKSFKFKAKHIQWYDVGTLNLYNNFIETFDGKHLYLHNTKHEYKYKKNEVFIKKTESEKKIVNLFERAKYLEAVIPKLLKRGKHFYSYKYVEGNTLYQLNNRDVYLKFLDWFGENFCKKYIHSHLVQSNSAHLFYHEKTMTRLQVLENTLENFNDLDKIQKINGIEVLPIKQYLDLVDWNNLSMIISTPLFHGDLQFDNIVANNDDFILIDWREDFGGDTSCGDLYYDLAKLNGGMELNYLEMKNPDHYFTLLGENECSITQYNDCILKEIQKNDFISFLQKYGFDKKRVKLLTAIIFLNMAPLHINQFDVFLFFKSKLLLSEYFSE